MSPRTELRDNERERYRFQWRLMIAIGAILLSFAVLLGRFIYLQVIAYERYLTLAENNRISLLPIPPSRGIISDRHGVVLAHNYSAYTLELIPSQITDMMATIQKLSKIVEISAKDRRRFKKLREESKDFESLPIKIKLSDIEVARFAAQSYRFPGVKIKARLFRDYPMGKSASHLLGYIGRINEQEIKALEKKANLANYKGSDHIGKFGIEKYYEQHLHGKTGYEEVETDAGGRVIRSLRRSPPVSGNNLTLTIDIKLQQLAEQAFADHNGALVALDPNNGEILALVSRPGFDPNVFVDGVDIHHWKALNESPNHPLNNRAIQGTYAPGSTFKPFMALAALELGKRTPQQSIQDPGFFLFGGHRFRDDKVGGHGRVDMYHSLVDSCDTYYYILANDLGIDNIAQFMKMFGFGRRTGVDLPTEHAGVLPSREWKRAMFRQPEQQKWYAGETISIGIGQGYHSYTPLQLAQATAILANRGKLFKPHLVKFIEDSASGQRVAVQPQHLGQLDFKAAHLDFIRAAMIGVNQHGTGRLAFHNAPYISAGKTGTAQRFSLKQHEKYVAEKLDKKLRDNALFIAFAPADKPRIALALVVENAGFGAKAAAPIARHVLDYFLLGKPAQKITHNPPNTPLHHVEKRP